MQANQTTTYSTLVECRLCLLGHLVRMSDNRLPKEVVSVCPAAGSRVARGQKHR